MAAGRYGTGGPARSGPSVKRAQKLIVDGRGEFAAPVRLEGAQYHSMLEAASSDAPAATPARDAFVYDDDLTWEQPLESVPVTERARQSAAPARGAAGQKRAPARGNSRRTRTAGATARAGAPMRAWR